SFSVLHDALPPRVSHFLLFALRPRPRPTLFPTRRSSDLIADVRAPARLPPVVPENVPVQRLPRPRIVGRRDVEDAVHLQNRSRQDRKSTRLNSSHVAISYAVLCLKKKSEYLPLTCNGRCH